MKWLFLVTCFLFSSYSVAGFEGLSHGRSLKVFNQLDCGTNLQCTKIKGKFAMSVKSELVAATATTIAKTQCGSTFYNAGAVVMNLPEASTALGCELTFVTLNASNFDVNPDNADQILVQTNAAGDSIRNATLGNTITLKAVSASQWVVVGILGTWTDNN
jgi:hypothetical protein